MGDARSLERAFGKAQAHGSRFDRALRGLGKAALYAGAALVGGAVVGLEKSVHAAVDAEASQARLAQAFKDAHVSLQPYLGSLVKVEAAGRKLGFTDTEVRDALGSLIVATHSYKRSVSDLSVAQDLARFKHIQLGDATKMLTMAMTGSQRAAKQLGIVVIPTTAAVDRLKRSHVDLTTATGKALLAQAKLQDKMALGQAVIEQVTAKTRGQSKAFSETAAGGLARFRAGLDHLEVTIGKIVLPALGALADKASGVMSKISDAISEHMPQIRAQLGSLASGLADVGGAIGRLALSPAGISLVSGALAGLAAAKVIGGIASLAVTVGEASVAMTGLGVAGLALSGPLGLGLAAAVGIGVGAFVLLSGSSDELTPKLNAVRDAIRGVKDAALGAENAHLALQQAHLTARTTLEAVWAAQKNYNKAVRDSGANSHAAHIAAEGLAQAELSHKQALYGVKSATEAASSASKKLGAAHTAETAKLRAMRDEGNNLIRTFGPSGLTHVISVGYAKALRDLDKSQGGARGSAAAYALAVETLTKKLGHLPSRKRVEIALPGAVRSLAQLDALKQKMDTLVRNVLIHVSTLFSSVGKRPPGRQGGGFVPGVGAVPIIAHADEVLLNPEQQAAFGGPEVFRQMFGFSGGPQSSFAAGGIVRKPKHVAPRLPERIREAELRAQGTPTLADDIAAYLSDQAWTSAELRRKDLTAGERNSLRRHLIQVRNRLKSLRARQAKAKRPKKKRATAPDTTDYTALPGWLQLQLARARATEGTADDLAALKAEESYLLGVLLHNRHMSDAQKAAVIDALTNVRADIKTIEDQKPDTSPDLQARLDQAIAQARSANLAAGLANAFVATGVFAGSTPAGGTNVTFQSLFPPTPEQARQAAAAAAEGASYGGYRIASSEKIGV